MLTCEDHDDDEECDHRDEEGFHIHRVVGVQRDVHTLNHVRSYCPYIHTILYINLKL